jgi:hypothetical protein
MDSITVFEWSVGVGAWLSLATIPLVSGVPSKPLWFFLLVGIPIVGISLVYVLTALFLKFLYGVCVVLSLMIRADVVTGLFVLMTLAATFGTALKLLEQLHTHPESLPPFVRGLVVQLDQFARATGHVLFRIYLRFGAGHGIEDLVLFLAKIPVEASVATVATVNTVTEQQKAGPNETNETDESEEAEETTAAVAETTAAETTAAAVAEETTTTETTETTAAVAEPSETTLESLASLALLTIPPSNELDLTAT